MAVLRLLARLGTEVTRFLIAVARSADALLSGPTLAANALIRVLVGGQLQAEPGNRDFEDRIDDLTDQLKRSGSEAQRLLGELADTMDARRDQMMAVHASLLQLQLEESELEERVSKLRTVRPEAADAIGEVLLTSLEQRDKIGRRRDWIIFGMGALVSSGVSLFLYFL